MSIQNLAIQHFIYGPTRSLLAGASLSYAVYNERYLEIPLTIFTPSMYAGYHLFKNKDEVVKWLGI